MTKTCNECGATKPLSGFYKNKGMADGYLNRCKPCHRSRVRAAPNAKRNRRKWRTENPEYEVWQGMVRRCYEPDHPGYHNYGGRGIAVVSRWLGDSGYDHFLEDMGHRPLDPEGWTSRKAYWTIDRIDVNGDYGPDNCRWASPTTQARNRRTREQVAADLAAQELSIAA